MKFTIAVNRISYSTVNFEVDADNIDSAKDIALEMAEDYTFSEHSSEYEVNEVR